MGDFIVIIVLLLIIGAAAFKLYKDKKNNVMCSGCPSCPSNLQCSKAQGPKGNPAKESIVFLNKPI